MSKQILWLKEAGVRLEGYVKKYQGAEPIESCQVIWNEDSSEGHVVLDNEIRWTVKAISSGVVDSEEGMELIVDFRSDGCSMQSTAALSFELDNWSERNYVLVPGAVYAGNRFGVRELPYAPCWSKLNDHVPEVPTLITDVPRLSVDRNLHSAFHLLTGDASTPAIGIVDEQAAMGWLFVTDQSTELGDSSMHMAESVDRSSAQISFQAPGVRPHFKYEMATTRVPSTDNGHDFLPGDSVRIRSRIYRFPCASIQELYDHFAVVRQQGQKQEGTASSLPFSAAWDIQEMKYNAMNWNDELGYYAVGTIDMKHQDWQIGWVGGGMSSYALLLEGSELSIARAIDTLHFIFSSQTESGFFHGVCYKGKWYGDEFNDDPDRLYPEQWHILRKSADALYFIMKHLIALVTIRPTFTIPERWLEGTKRLADAFVKLWRMNGQFGQWVHSRTGEIVIGGSAGAAIAPAGLALCGRYFEDDIYKKTAELSANEYYEQFTRKGVTTGGPGEILQCPDSESAFALLESYIVLYETTGDRLWIKRAEEAALQAMTWCVSYNFRFPAGSTFDRLGIRTKGSVIANVQNKHSAPGICTLSGDSLFKLYRATGNKLYMDLLQEIAGNLPQYLSRQDRPIRGWDGHDMPPGYMSERVNMSDWEGKAYVGEVIPYSCWCEVSLMLSYAELPGIYVNKTKNQVSVIDGVMCSMNVTEEGIRILKVSNPTSFPAKVKLLAEDEEQAASTLLESCASITWQRIELASGETIEVII
ncbi:hypothetical protein FHS15_002745 [Paenibacillus castaneae]|uniref:hypothetical protein n=1 Tax=Paenibacillus castaneae TaxID=474957 RepID=UPI000C9C2C43|nr:hypothetical protein [Paenibacillus castaneae]NIK77609.1 hypothetical protein [Paenibacillus castaneae]